MSIIRDIKKVKAEKEQTFQGVLKGFCDPLDIQIFFFNFDIIFKYK